MRASDLKFFRYFPVSRRDRQWGLYVSAVGSTHVPPHSRRYPLRDHPDAYIYAWETGRVLHQYQALYIAQGQGRYESSQLGSRPVSAGTVILLFPGEWHRYRPGVKSGWDEYWVSFGGTYAEHLIEEGFFSPGNPLLAVGMDETIQHAYLELMDRPRDEPIGHQQLNAASVQETLAATLAAVRRQWHGGCSENVVRKAKAALEEQVEGTISITKLSRALRLSEEHLRRRFREHTGMSPYPYYLALKTHRAQMLLRDTNMTVKQIAHKLGFESPFHFSKTFKQRTGVSPSRWRRAAKGD